MMMMMNYNDGVYFPASKAVCGPLMSAGRKSIIKSGLTRLSEASFVFISGLKSNQLDLVVCLFSLIFPVKVVPVMNDARTQFVGLMWNVQIL